MKETLQHAVAEALEALYGMKEGGFSVEAPHDLAHGDYSTNAALVVAKKLNKSPQDIATDLAAHLATRIGAAISVASPGFINFTLPPSFFQETIQQIKKNERWGASSIHVGKKILVEHSSPNLFKPFHIGHVMNNCVGEAIVRLANFSGATVTAISYPSDISLGIAKAVFILLEDAVATLETFPTIDEKIEYLGDCYVRGTARFDQDERVQLRVREIAAKLYDHVLGDELRAYKEGRDITLAYFKSIVARLGSSFDAFVYESEAGETGKQIVAAHLPGVFDESEGAVVYKGEADGLHTRVFINREGYPTYEAKDLGLLSIKFDRFNPDISIFITDNQQEEYFKVVIAAAGKINKAWKEKTIHRTHGRMSFRGKKMSSRLGGVPVAVALLDTVRSDALECSPTLSIESADMIGIAAIKFSILRALAGKNIDFDPDTSLSFEGDSGPYLQYSVVRAKSVLENAARQGLAVGCLAVESLAGDSAMGKEYVPTDMERILIHFPEVVERSIAEWAPHHVVSYLLTLAQAFNSWYGSTKIIDAQDPASAYKLALTDAFVRVMTSGLYLLAIKIPEKM